MNNELYIKKCLALARKSEMKNEIPVGAILTQNNIILAESHNLSISANDPTAHAEINVIRLACEKINNYRIKDSVLYTTLEPCLMCMGAICEARIDCIVFGASSSSESCIDEKFKILKETYALDHTPKFIGGILQKECSLMLRNFFKRKRG